GLASEEPVVMRLSPKHVSHSACDSEVGEVGLCWTERGLVEVLRLGQGEPIVLVSGLAGGWKLIAPLARRLARTNSVICYGLAGDAGVRERERHSGIGDYALDLAALIAGLGLERPTVMGVSFGGAIALQLATDRPGLMGELIVSGIA